MPTPAKVGRTRDGRLLGEYQGSFYVGTPTKVVGSDLTVESVLSGDSLTQTATWRDQVVWSQTLDRETWIEHQVDTLVKRDASEEDRQAVRDYLVPRWEAECSRVSQEDGFSSKSVIVIEDGEVVSEGSQTYPVTYEVIEWEAI